LRIRPRLNAGAVRRFRFDVVHRLHRDLREIERMVAALGIETPPQRCAKRLALELIERPLLALIEEARFFFLCAHPNPSLLSKRI
jgi:hypothetical protein